MLKNSLFSGHLHLVLQNIQLQIKDDLIAPVSYMSVDVETMQVCWVRWLYKRSVNG